MKKAILIFFVCFVSAIFLIFAEADETVELSIISANISGLPSFASKYDRDVSQSQKTLGKMLNEKGYDIVCVQENYQYHSVFSAEMSNYPYKTYETGGVPIGDGLNIFSVYPIYNVERVAWKRVHGIFADGSDALTPKGFLRCTVDVNGTLIELYNVHMDAYATEGDQLAKKAQLEQLMAYINKHSPNRPKLIVGDTNITFHKEPLVEPHAIVIEGGGFLDCWIEVKNNGNYMQGSDRSAVIDAWYEKFGGHDWGRWDSVERVWYRSGGGLDFQPTQFEYVVYSDDPADKKALTDHRIMECVMQIDLDEYVRPSDAVIKEPKAPSFFAKTVRAIAMWVRFLAIVLWGALEYLASNYPLAVIIAVFTVLFVSIAKIRKKKQKN